MKKIVRFLVWSFPVIALIVSCDRMNDIQQKYVDSSSDRVYLGKNDSLTAYGGYERVKLVWYINSDPKIETTVVFWNNRLDSLEIPFVRKQEGIQKDSVIIDRNMDGTPLAEGTYIFEVINKNQYGERSLTSITEGNSYGEVYAGSLSDRPVISLSSEGFDPLTQSSTIKIRWDEALEGCITKITYNKRSTGVETVVFISETESEMTLMDVGNRFEHPDDVLYISSVYAPEGMIDPIETPKKKAQLAHFLASGTRIENTVYEGSNTTFTFSYTNQEKILILTGDNVYECNRIAEFAPSTTGSLFRMKLSEDQTFEVSGNYSIATNVIANTGSVGSIFDPATGNITLRYTVKTTGGSYTVEETLVPKTTPFEKEAPKPFIDRRESIPGDNTTQLGAGYSFTTISDGIHAPTFENGWIPAGNTGRVSVTIDINEKMKLSRVILWPTLQSNNRLSIYAFMNVMKCELWGTAELDESKLQDEAYWADAADPTGTFKEDWVFLGVHEVERLDKRNATDNEIINRGVDGNQFIIPESAGPVRYIRFFCRENVATADISYFFIGELSFFGYTQ